MNFRQHVVVNDATRAIVAETAFDDAVTLQ